MDSIASRVSIEDFKHRFIPKTQEWSRELENQLKSIRSCAERIIGNLPGNYKESSEIAIATTLQEDIDMVTESHEKLRQMLPVILSHISRMIKLVRDRLNSTKWIPGMNKNLITYALEKLEENSEYLGIITVAIDTSGLYDLLNDEIHSFLTVTGSRQDSFASSALRYVNWCWGQRGVDILSWVSLVSSISSVRVDLPTRKYSYLQKKFPGLT